MRVNIDCNQDCLNCTYDKCLGEMTEKQRTKALGEKQQPPEWTLKDCKTIDDPAEKERLRKELEKKEKRRQQNREAQKRWQEKKKAEKEAAKEREKAEQPKKTFADVAAELEQMETPVEEPNVDESLDRLAKLREMTELTVQESVKTEELTEDIVEEPAPDQEVVVEGGATTIKNNVILVLTSSEAESLYEFIKDELLTVVKRDDVDELDWLADMCSIYKCLRGELIRDA